MAHLLDKRRWREQPRGPVRVRWNRAATDGLIFAYIPGNPIEFALQQRMITGRPVTSGPGGICTNPAIGATYTEVPAPVNASSPTARYDLSALTALIIAKQTTQTNNGIDFCRGHGSSVPGWAIGLHGGSFDGPYAYIGNYGYTPTAANDAMHSDARVAVLSANGSVASVYLDGVYVGGGSYTPPTYAYDSAAHRTVVIGSNGAGNGLSTQNYLSLLWDHGNDAGLIRDVSLAPYGEIFERNPMPVHFILGGSVFSASISGAASATSAMTAAESTGASLISNVSASAVKSGLSTLSASRLEVITASESPGGVRSTTVAASEGLTASSTPTVSVAFQAPWVSIASAQTTQTTQLLSQALISGTATALDSMNSLGTVGVGLVETSNALDGWSIQAMKVAALVEQLVGVESSSSLSELLGVQSDNTVPVDATNAILTDLVSLSSSLSAHDAISSQSFQGMVSLANANATDDPSVVAVVNGGISAIVNASALPLVSSLVAVSILDNTTATDDLFTGTSSVEQCVESISAFVDQTALNLITMALLENQTAQDNPAGEVLAGIATLLETSAAADAYEATRNVFIDFSEQAAAHDVVSLLADLLGSTLNYRILIKGVRRSVIISSTKHSIRIH